MNLAMNVTVAPVLFANDQMECMLQDASRTSRQLMRVGAALLEMGRFSGLVSHAAQGHVGPLVYSNTGFLRPDGQVCKAGSIAHPHHCV